MGTDARSRVARGSGMPRSMRLGYAGVLFLGACGAAPPPASKPPDVRACTVAFRFEEPPAPADEHDAPPHTTLALALVCEQEARRVFPLGESIGACFRERDPRAILTARCWWGPEGELWSVTREDDLLVVERRPATREGQNSAGGVRTRTIELPDSVSVEAL
jgi:hypothetical protein